MKSTKNPTADALELFTACAENFGYFNVENDSYELQQNIDTLEEVLPLLERGNKEGAQERKVALYCYNYDGDCGGLDLLDNRGGSDAQYTFYSLKSCGAIETVLPKATYTALVELLNEKKESLKVSAKKPTAPAPAKKKAPAPAKKTPAIKPTAIQVATALKNNCSPKNQEVVVSVDSVESAKAKAYQVISDIEKGSIGSSCFFEHSPKNQTIVIKKTQFGQTITAKTLHYSIV